MMLRWSRRQLSVLLLFASFVLTAGAADADSFQPFDIPAGEAERTLKQFATQSGLEVLYSTEAARGVRTNAVKGRLIAREAVTQMLSGTPLYVVNDSKNGVLRIARINDPNAPRAAQKATCADPKNLPALIPPLIPQHE